MTFRAVLLRLGVAALGSVVAACAGLPPSQPQQPTARDQAPGFYRIWLGDFEVTALSDGTSPFQAAWLTNVSPANIETGLSKHFLKAPVETSFSAYLVNTGTKIILVDAGTGSFLGPALGKLLDNLAAAGYRPEQIDEIYITHLHVDHVGGLVSGDKIAFPNAIVRADEHDAAYWLSDKNMKNAPADMKLFFEGARASLNPYIAAGKFKPFDGDTELVPGIKAVATRGHTPGHAFYVAESNGQRMVFWGDLVHVASLQLPNPSVTVVFDVDNKAAVTQRRKAFADAARRGDLIAASHISFPGIGRLRTEGKGYAWVPINYAVKAATSPTP
jgi:glyoxylase-like metal-dependent hydrolase (beta-lactamase superfamily II)